MSWFFAMLLLGLAWLWWDGLGAKEVARQAGKALCQKHAVQFLDDTVAQARLGVRRDTGGNLRLYRRFAFEFSTDGETRYHGHVDMLGQRVFASYMEPYRL